MTIGKRIGALEALFKGRERPPEPVETGSLDVVRAKLDVLDAEYARRAGLSREEQLRLLRDDHQKELERRQHGLGHGRPGMPPGLAAAADRIFAHAESELEAAIRAGNGSPALYQTATPQ